MNRTSRPESTLCSNQLAATTPVLQTPRRAFCICLDCRAAGAHTRFPSPATLGVHAKMATDDPRWFHETYGITSDGEEVTAADIAAALTEYADRVTQYDAERAAQTAHANL
jgi:hypothetical protein